jgi:peptidoglycan/xylan/chitin deacetylase (PgdA/CDA1 family)
MAIVLLLLAAIWLPPSDSVTRVPIFGFHRIVDLRSSDHSPFRWGDSIFDYPRPRLEAFLEHVAQGGYWTLTADELYHYFIAQPRAAIPPQHVHQRPIALTFDDGYRSIHTDLLPILERLQSRYRRQINVILFINSGQLGRREGSIAYMSCEELREGFRKGFYDVQSHTVNHFDLTGLPDRELAYELSQDQVNLRRCIGDLDSRHSVARHIAYPYGAHSPRVERHASRYFLSGYLYNGSALSLEASLGIPFDQAANPYRIPRLIVRERDSLGRLIHLADGSARPEAPVTRNNPMGARP